MPERTSYADGIPSWADLSTTDKAGAEAFYGELFGWEFAQAPAGEPGMEYTMMTKRGKMVAGMGVLSEEQQSQGIPPNWSTYLAAKDLDATLQKVIDSGGSVIVPAMDVGDTGRMAFIADPTGAAIGLWQAGSHTGSELVNEHGTVTWNELMTNDAVSAAKFYVNVFGYRLDTVPMEYGHYSLLMADGNLEGYYAAGMMQMPEDMKGVPSYWSVYFAVDDCDTTLEAAKSAGGAVIAEAFDVPDTGRMAVIQDPQGAVFSVMKPANELQ